MTSLSSMTRDTPQSNQFGTCRSKNHFHKWNCRGFVSLTKMCRRCKVLGSRTWIRQLIRIICVKRRMYVAIRAFGLSPWGKKWNIASFHATIESHYYRIPIRPNHFCCKDHGCSIPASNPTTLQLLLKTTILKKTSTSCKQIWIIFAVIALERVRIGLALTMVYFFVSSALESIGHLVYRLALLEACNWTCSSMIKSRC